VCVSYRTRYLMKKNVSTENVALLTSWNNSWRSAIARNSMLSGEITKYVCRVRNVHRRIRSAVAASRE